jgi:protein-S-isoprenylcysteine O-methyltransferase Ste14
MRSVSRWRHLRAIVLLPGTAAVVAPALIAAGADDAHVQLPLAVLGALLIAIGVTLFVQTVALFARVGQGTLAPWDPTSELVVEGPYRRVRNPMISGVLFVLLGETAILGSRAMLIYAAAFFAANAIWMPLVEEPKLRERFGAAYDEYAANVPRWVPRLSAWDPR